MPDIYELRQAPPPTGLMGKGEIKSKTKFRTENIESGFSSYQTQDDHRF